MARRNDYQRPRGICALCGRLKAICGRGLCRTCYQREYYHANKDDLKKKRSMYRLEKIEDPQDPGLCILCQSPAHFDRRCISCIAIGADRVEKKQCPDCGTEVATKGHWCRVCYSKDLTGRSPDPSVTPISYVPRVMT